jgi:hypothetical protein
MIEKIDTAIDAREAMQAIHRQLLRLPYNPDLSRLAKNIGTMITNLSQMEVAARNVRNVRNHSARLAAERCKEDIINAIKHLEQLILVATLMA